jgi:glycosyltransferase involved in cell wall biosynthesis
MSLDAPAISESAALNGGLDGHIAFAMTGEFHRNARAIKQVRSLTSAGFSVTVIHLSGSAPAVSLPEGTSIVDLTRPNGKGPLFFKQVSRLFLVSLASIEADIWHASDLYALSACRRRADESGSALTYDAREYYPHVAGTVGRPWSRWWWARTERSGIRRADSVFTVSDSIADALAADYGIPRPHVVHNAPPMQAREDKDHVSGLKERTGQNGPFIVHLGQMKAHRGGEGLVRAMQSVDEAQLVFLGYGSEQSNLEELTRDLGLSDRIHFLEPVAPDEIRMAIRDARIGVTMLEDTCLNHRYALPNKLFDYVHAGIPVLGADLDEVRSITARFDIGRTADPSDPDSIAAALRTMMHQELQQRWRSNLPQAAETFTWESASQGFLDGMALALKRHAR